MIFSAVQFILTVAACTAAGLHAMHVLQVQRYRIDDLRKHLHRGDENALTHELPIMVLAVLLNWYLPVLLSMAIQKQNVRTEVCNWSVLGIFLIAVALLCLQKRRMSLSKPFKFTRRMVRLIAMTALVNTAGIVVLKLLTLPPYIMFAATNYVVMLCASIMQPVEEGINARYYASARKKIAAHKNLVCIGITGSYGKTEVKQMLKTILSERFKVLATPPGYSTAMGISRVANEELDDSHEIYIAEMGAQRIGEIKDMAKLMRPKYGVLTCVSDAHLDTFGSMDAIAQAKSELLQALPKDGAAFFGSDRSYGDRLYALQTGEKYRAGIGTATDCWIWAEHVETGVAGTRFELICKDGTHAWMQTQLLGKYAVKNIALSAAVAKKLGMKMEEIAKGTAKLKPFRHHLQLISGAFNVIDDSANKDPKAAAEALKVLADFPGRRVLVTGGFPELGKRAEDAGYDFGLKIPDCADYVILVDSTRTKSIMHALNSKQFPKSAIRMVNAQEDAAAFVREIVGKGDTVLYEGVWPSEDET